MCFPPSLGVCLCCGGFGCRTGRSCWDLGLDEPSASTGHCTELTSLAGWLVTTTASPKPISLPALDNPTQTWASCWGGLGAATRVSSPSLALREVGRLFFFLYHPVCFKPCDLHGCRHHLLPVLAYSTWLDLGLFLFYHGAVKPGPDLQLCLHTTPLLKHSSGEDPF